MSLQRQYFLLSSVPGLPAKDTSSRFALQINENSLINFVVDLSPLRAAKCN